MAGHGRRRDRLRRPGAGTAAGFGVLLLAGCIRNPAPTPAQPPPLDWPTVLGDVRRAAFAATAAPDSGRAVWSIGVGRGLLATPIVAPPLVIIGTSNRMVVAYSTATGAENWERHVDGAIGTAVVAGGGRIYAVSGERDGKAYALEPLHGRVQWHRSIGYAVAAPLLMGDTLVVPVDGGRVVALQARNGHPIWTARLPATAATTPVPSGDVLAIAARNDSIFTLQRSTGVVVGRARLGGFASATPALAGDTLLVPVEAGGLVALRLPDLARLFEVRGSTDADGATVLAAPVVAPDGAVYFLESGGGLWRLPPGDVTAVKVADAGGAVRGALTLVRDGFIVGRLDGTLLRLGLGGGVAWSLTLDGSIFAPAAAVDGTLYVPLERGRIVKVQ